MIRGMWKSGIVGALAVAAGCSSQGGSGDDACDGARSGCPSWEACFDGECLDIPLYECVDGEWVDSSTICEGPIYVPRMTVIALQPAFEASGGCPALTPPPTVAIEILEDAVTVTPAVTIRSAGVSGHWNGTADVRVLFDATWGGVDVQGDYGLQVENSGAWGVLGLTWAGCSTTITLTTETCPTGVEACGVADDGWNVQCRDGVVHADDLSRHLYCGDGEGTPACWLGGAGDASLVAVCAGACLDEDVRWFETFEEYAAFDPASLCAAP